MMKQYKKPSIRVVNISLNTLIAASVKIAVSTDDADENFDVLGKSRNGDDYDSEW